jgi:hypothetical protein
MSSTPLLGPAPRENHLLGVFLFVSSSSVACVLQTIGRYLYLNNPALTTLQLVWYRSILSVIFQSIWLNKRLLLQMTVTRQNVIPITVRMSQVSFSVVVTYYALQNF